MFCWLEGDDALCDGFFKAIQGAIVEQKIDVSQPVGIQANYKVIDTNGNVRIIPNDYLSGHKCNPTSEKINKPEIRILPLFLIILFIIISSFK